MDKSIEDLIPHRPPFIFLDKLVTVNSEEIVGEKTFDASNPILKGSFPELKCVPGTILLEAMAQCGGAGVRMLGISNGIFALAYIETAQFFGAIRFDEKVRFVIKNVRLSEKMIKQSGKAYFEDNLLLEASWMSIRIEQQ